MINTYFGEQEDDTLGFQSLHAAADADMDPMGLSADDDEDEEDEESDEMGEVDEVEDEEEEDGDDDEVEDES